jgi:peptidoglycan/xylan/chitin deacetylase (PgdA/CDA1 family)
MRFITVFFDLEAPFLWKDEAKFDLEETLKNISGILNRFGVKAVFNTCGIVAEKFPKTISLLYEEGHEIASHGYAHENFLKMSPRDLNDVLAKTEQVLLDITGKRPTGIRDPWLLKSKETYVVLKNRSYSWASNYHVPFWTTRSSLNEGATSRPKWMLGRTIYMVKRFLQKKEPFCESSLLEIPLLSPMDIFCIYPFPNAKENSPESSLEEAYSILVEHYEHSKEYFNLNFHEHIIGTANRAWLLEKMLEYLSAKSDARFVLPHKLPQLA